MKKYKKPEIIIERFELSQNVADCTWELTYNDGNTCIGTASDKGISVFLFTEANGSCGLMETAVEDYCYTAATDGKVSFKS